MACANFAALPSLQHDKHQSTEFEQWIKLGWVSGL
jgi:hypothetical protein